MGDYRLQKKGSDSSHELNLACCQLEGRHLYCRSVRVIVKPFVSGGRKNYSFIYGNNKHKCVIKGFGLDHEISKYYITQI